MHLTTFLYSTLLTLTMAGPLGPAVDASLRDHAARSLEDGDLSRIENRAAVRIAFPSLR